MKSQIWVAVSVCVLVAIIRKRLDPDASLYALLQILSVTLFEKTPLNQCLLEPDHTFGQGMDPNQLNLFEYCPDTSNVVFFWPPKQKREKMVLNTNVLDPTLFEGGDPRCNGLPHETFDWLRRNSPCHFQEIDDPMLAGSAWVLSRHEDVLKQASNEKQFIASKGVSLRKFDVGVPEHGGKPTMLTLDGDDHLRNRRIVGRGFAPAVIKSFEEKFREIAVDVLDKAIAQGECDLVSQVAAELPLKAICELLGVPLEDQYDILHWVNVTTGFTDPDVATSMEEVMDSLQKIWAYGLRLAKLKQQDPAEDVFSRIAAANESEQLSDDETMGMMMLLAGAGNETTRNSITHGLHALLRYPDQMLLLRDNIDGRIVAAVEEIVRWSSPVIGAGRTAVEDVEMHGQTISAGDRIWLLIASANFDPEVFNSPKTFNIEREPNRHLSFNPGKHACLGAAVARLELKILFEELLARTSDIELLGDPAYTRDMFLRGIKSMPVRFKAA